MRKKELIIQKTVCLKTSSFLVSQSYYHCILSYGSYFFKIVTHYYTGYQIFTIVLFFIMGLESTKTTSDLANLVKIFKPCLVNVYYFIALVPYFTLFLCDLDVTSNSSNL